MGKILIAAALIVIILGIYPLFGGKTQCRNCGAYMPRRAKICPNCGYRRRENYDNPYQH